MVEYIFTSVFYELLVNQINTIIKKKSISEKKSKRYLVIKLSFFSKKDNTKQLIKTIDIY
ncbi:hypothetical protein C3D39_25175 [Escherichia coli O51]|nr:hypothetical protein [Escherichia coli O51]